MAMAVTLLVGAGLLLRTNAALGTISGTRGGTLVAGMRFSGDGARIPFRAEGSELSWDEAPIAFVPTVATG